MQPSVAISSRSAFAVPEEDDADAQPTAASVVMGSPLPAVPPVATSRDFKRTSFLSHVRAVMQTKRRGLMNLRFAFVLKEAYMTCSDLVESERAVFHDVLRAFEERAMGIVVDYRHRSEMEVEAVEGRAAVTIPEALSRLQLHLLLVEVQADHGCLLFLAEFANFWQFEEQTFALAMQYLKVHRECVLMESREVDNQLIKHAQRQRHIERQFDMRHSLIRTEERERQMVEREFKSFHIRASAELNQLAIGVIETFQRKKMDRDAQAIVKRLLLDLYPLLLEDVAIDESRMRRLLSVTRYEYLVEQLRHHALALALQHDEDAVRRDVEVWQLRIRAVIQQAHLQANIDDVARVEARERSRLLRVLSREHYMAISKLQPLLLCQHHEDRARAEVAMSRRLEMGLIVQALLATFPLAWQVSERRQRQGIEDNCSVGYRALALHFYSLHLVTEEKQHRNVIAIQFYVTLKQKAAPWIAWNLNHAEAHLLTLDIEIRTKIWLEALQTIMSTYREQVLKLQSLRRREILLEARSGKEKLVDYLIQSAHVMAIQHAAAKYT